MNQAELEILSKPKVQEFIREKMGKIIIGDHIRWIDSEDDVVRTDFQASCVMGGNGYTIFPLAIDHRNPERGLWGMIEGYKSIYSGKSRLTGKEVTRVDLTEKDGTIIRSFSTDTPYLALLKALEAQIEINDVTQSMQ